MAEARATVFLLAGVVDDGSVTLKRAYRAAALKHHPDIGGDERLCKTLNTAADVLRAAGLL
ncbi:hypothetical protein ACIOEX_02385 [Streptomyces sp. NPDC087850]|uniref:hypothetical protein n=1 Tax=Streptomyces sp. NPDC087850 TaxID=3365809 RepID=UPI003807E5CF